MGAFSAQSRDFVLRVNLVELQNSKLDLLPLVLDLLWLCVSLLLALLASARQVCRQKESRLILNATSTQDVRIHQRPTTEDQVLIV